MRSALKTAIIGIAWTAFCLSSLWADEVIVVMVTGERFSSSKVWEEEGKIRFNLQGLVVSVEKSEVATILHSQSSGDRNARIEPPQPPQKPHKQPEPEHSSHLFTYSDNHSAPGPGRPIAPAMDPGAGSLRPPPSGRSRAMEGIGLEGIAWRMPGEQIEGLEKIGIDPAFGGIAQYWRPEAPLQFGDALLDGLVYAFWHNQLYTIIMWADGRIGYDRLRTEVFSRFGRGLQSDPQVERYVWVGEQTQRMLEFDARIKTGMFVMRSVELHHQIRQTHPD